MPEIEYYSDDENSVMLVHPPWPPPFFTGTAEDELAAHHWIGVVKVYARHAVRPEEWVWYVCTYMKRHALIWSVLWRQSRLPEGVSLSCPDLSGPYDWDEFSEDFIKRFS